MTFTDKMDFFTKQQQLKSIIGKKIKAIEMIQLLNSLQSLYVVVEVPVAVQIWDFFFYYYNIELFKKQISKSDPIFKGEGNARSPKSEYTFEYTTKLS